MNEELQETQKLWEKPQKWETIRIGGETMSCGREWGIVKDRELWKKRGNCGNDSFKRQRDNYVREKELYACNGQL